MQSPGKVRDRSSAGSVAAGLSLSTLLSHALVAFTIEFDNEFEHRMPHRTTKYSPKVGSRGGPWLTSLVMWSNCMQWVGEAGVRVGELENLAAYQDEPERHGQMGLHYHRTR